ncbi:hypothetical protein Pcinc_030943 [Petrolisthes cinctipes]|uniref:Alpha-taxilin n=1 Tax=Petrolisthes cinctipes TaxID=88211 RepID=A0AAE1EXB5_PETCI|nr:hypothetical protein Pcinc_030943 [Petrolisthes cinctipes]
MADTKANKQAQKKDKKKRDAGVEAITTALKALPPDQQVAMLLSKYVELAEDNRNLTASSKSIERQVQTLQREKDQMDLEHTKAVLTKSKLESLCRELQRQNKVIKDENLARLKEEEERRKEVSTKFNNTISEISTQMKENTDKNSKLRDENKDMEGRLQDLRKQYEAREAHVEKLLKQRDLQCQLAEAKIAKLQIEMTEEKEKMLMEKKTLLEEIASYQQKTQQMSMTEISLRTQLNSYMDKYEEFQTMLDKSNKIFNTFKKEMDEMNKKIKKLEKETKTWKERWEGSNKALLDMVTERSELKQRIDTQARQNTQLQNLCRALQTQLTELRNKEKEINASRSSETEKIDNEKIEDEKIENEKIENEKIKNEKIGDEKIEELEERSKVKGEEDKKESNEPTLVKPSGEENDNVATNSVAETSLQEECSSKLENVEAHIPDVISKEKMESVITNGEEVAKQVKDGADVVQQSVETEKVLLDEKVEILVPNIPEVTEQVVNGDVSSKETECTKEETLTQHSEKEEEEVDDDEMPPLASYYDDVD